MMMMMVLMVVPMVMMMSVVGGDVHVVCLDALFLHDVEHAPLPVLQQFRFGLLYFVCGGQHGLGCTTLEQLLGGLMMLLLVL
jgi:hypothetical protein